MFILWPLTIIILVIVLFIWWLTYRNAKEYGIVWDATRFSDSFTKKDNQKSFKHWYYWRMAETIIMVIIAFALLFY